MKTRKNIYGSKKILKRNIDLLLIEEEDKKHYVLIKDFNTFTHDHTLHRGAKTFLLLLFTGL